MPLKSTVGVAAVAGCLFAIGAQADPVPLTHTQMDAVVAAGVARVDGFVCPVITTENVLHSPKAAAIAGGHYTIIGPDVSIPLHATNTLDNGTSGAPGGAHAAPGDRGYTAIWAK